jgi:hypothetical protein
MILDQQTHSVAGLGVSYRLHPVISPYIHRPLQMNSLQEHTIYGCVTWYEPSFHWLRVQTLRRRDYL